MLLDYATLPPEINSGRLHDGPGSGPLLSAASAWRSLAAELRVAAESYRSVVTELATSPWTGQSAAAMAATIAPYVTWMEQTAGVAEQTVARLDAAVLAYEGARAVIVHPTTVDGNRDLRDALVRTNVIGQNTPAIAATEIAYAEMWVQDALAMFGYAGASEGAANVVPFSPPPQHLTATLAQSLQGQGQHAAARSGTAHAGSSAARSANLGSQLAGRIGVLTRVATMEGRLALPMTLQVLRSVSLATSGRPRLASSTAAAGAGRGAGRAAGGATRLGAGLGRLASAAAAAPATAALGHAGTVGRLSVPMAWGMTNPVGGSALAGHLNPAHLMHAGAQQIGMLGHPHQHAGGPGKPTPRPDRTESTREAAEAFTGKLPSGGRVDFSRAPEPRAALV